METIKRITEINPGDVPLLERVFGQSLATAPNAELILRVPEVPAPLDAGDVPAWCNVLEGMSDDDLADFNGILAAPVRLGRHAD